jgi:ArsR family transcriptional regulator
VSENVFKAILNPVRLQILSCLNKQDLSVNNIISKCGLSQSAVSQHLKILKDFDLVECRKEGREVTYKIINGKAGRIADLVFTLNKEDKK